MTGKPDTRAAMRTLIREIRNAMPFGAAQAQVCSDSCAGCSRKLLDYLESELEGWEERLDADARPELRDLSRLAGTARKIHATLIRNGVVAPR